MSKHKLVPRRRSSPASTAAQSATSPTTPFATSSPRVQAATDDPQGVPESVFHVQRHRPRLRPPAPRHQGRLPRPASTETSTRAYAEAIERIEEMVSRLAGPTLSCLRSSSRASRCRPAPLSPISPRTATPTSSTSASSMSTPAISSRWSTPSASPAGTGAHTLPDLPRPPQRQPLSLYVLPRPRRLPDCRRRHRVRGQGREWRRLHPPHRRHPSPRRNPRRRRRQRGPSSRAARSSAPST